MPEPGEQENYAELIRDNYNFIPADDVVQDKIGQTAYVRDRRVACRSLSANIQVQFSPKDIT